LLFPLGISFTQVSNREITYFRHFLENRLIDRHVEACIAVSLSYTFFYNLLRFIEFIESAIGMVIVSGTIKYVIHKENNGKCIKCKATSERPYNNDR
jgi:hypothetical protein